MNVSRDEAAEALGEIRRAGRRMEQLRTYADAAPHFIIWGVVWLAAYSVTDLAPQLTNPAWGVCLTLGAAASFAAGYMTNRARKRGAAKTDDSALRSYGSRFAMLGAVFFFFFLCLFIINPVSSSREGSTLIAIIFPFIYMGVGVFAGWRLFAIGAIAAALIMAGFFLVTAHFYLYMGVIAGGALILAGLWLRKA